MKFKGLKITKTSKGDIEVTPLYHAGKGGTRPAMSLSAREDFVEDAVEVVLGRLVARGDLAE